MMRRFFVDRRAAETSSSGESGSSAVALVAGRCWGRLEFELLGCSPWPAEEQECERYADPGEDGDGEEGGLEAFGQADEWVRAGVGGEVVVGAGDGDGGDDGDAEGGADLERGVAEAGGDSGFALGDAGESSDRGGDEGEADAWAEDEQPEEDVAEVAAADGDLGEEERACAHQRHAEGGDGPEADPEHDRLSEDRADGGHGGEDERGEPELDRRIAEHLLGVEGEGEAEPVGERPEDEHNGVGADDRPSSEDAERHEWGAVARLDQREGPEQAAEPARSR